MSFTRRGRFSCIYRRHWLLVADDGEQDSVVEGNLHRVVRMFAFPDGLARRSVQDADWFAVTERNVDAVADGDQTLC